MVPSILQSPCTTLPAALLPAAASLPPLHLCRVVSCRRPNPRSPATVPRASPSTTQPVCDPCVPQPRSTPQPCRQSKLTTAVSLLSRRRRSVRDADQFAVNPAHRQPVFPLLADADKTSRCCTVSSLPRFSVPCVLQATVDPSPPQHPQRTADLCPVPDRFLSHGVVSCLTALSLY
ncbi:hypothetical protein M0R45_035908 [Rubus argutus]|uniref:Uncharacterized protein n=1 Tax=Rubus argutus TaxID=59490 RepID=A0AAW1VYR0_RUBAR